MKRQPDITQINLASREVVTRYQIDACLAVVAMSGSMLGHYLRVTPEEPGQDVPKCPEAQIALENTLTAACARLDEVLKDDTRWGMKFQDEVEKNYTIAQKLQMELLLTQQEAAAEITSPHFRYRPTLFRMKDGSWCAFLGDLNFMDLGVVGVGNSAQEAIKAFDDAFRGITNQQVLDWCKQRENNLETGAPDAPFPINQNEQQKVDPNGPNDSDRPGETKIDQSTDCATDESQPGLSGPYPPAFKHQGSGWLNRLRQIFRRRD